jgi:hypothetical protein
VETSTVSPVLLEAGLSALSQGQYSEAIGILEAFCHDCALNAQLTSRDYLRAQMHLIEIYGQHGQTERALNLCQQLTACDHAQVQIWAEQRLKTMTLTPMMGSPAPSPRFALLGKLIQRFRSA